MAYEELNNEMVENDETQVFDTDNSVEGENVVNEAQGIDGKKVAAFAGVGALVTVGVVVLAKKVIVPAAKHVAHKASDKIESFKESRAEKKADKKAEKIEAEYIVVEPKSE